MNISKIIKIFSKFSLALLLGLLVSIFVFKNDPMVKKKIEQKLKPLFSYLLDNQVSFNVEKIDLFPLQLTIKNVYTKSLKNKNWFWQCDSLVVGCSWFDFLFYGIMSLKIEMHDVEAETILDNNGLLIWKYIQQLYEGQSIVPVFLQRLKIKNSTLKIYEQQYKTIANSTFSIDLGTIGNSIKGTVYFQNGSISIQNLTLLEQLRGSVRFDILGSSESLKLMIKPQCTICVTQMENKKNCSISGLWKYDHGLFSIKNDDRSFLFGPIKLYLVGNTLFSELIGRFPAACLYRSFFDQEKKAPICGECTVKMNIDFDEELSTVRAELITGPIQYGKQVVLSASKLSCSRSNNKWTGSLFCSLKKGDSFLGQYQWNEKENKGTVTFKNQNDIKLFNDSYWFILPEECNVQIKYENNLLDGHYYCTATNKKINSHVGCSGTICLQQDKLLTKGTIGEKSFTASCGFSPTFSLHGLQCLQNETILLDISSHKKKPQTIVGQVNFALFNQLFESITGKQLNGEGLFTFNGEYKNKKLKAHIYLSDGNIRIPGTYNFLRQFYGKVLFDPSENLLIAQDISCLLHRGKIKILRAVCQFDQAYQPTFFHVPVFFRNCLVNFKKDLFSVASGSLVVKKEKKSIPIVKGSIFLERSQLKQNIFSTAFQKDLFGFSQNSPEKTKQNILFDIKIKTKEPVRVETSFLQTSLLIDLGLNGSLENPILSGKISLSSGSLAFPYKPLLLTKGQINFISGKIDEPLIEINAKNKIKKYNVDLQIIGTAKEQQIILQSSPPLSQEQILSLLLVGSEHESLNILMPALIMQNVKNIMFDSEQTRSGVRSAFARLFKPLERIRLVPSFTDQTGRGGLRGTVEIDINERWRAMIQKNFSMTEDTKVEAEYLLSDEISLRAIRNERGDIGAEVEMRWKL